MKNSAARKLKQVPKGYLVMGVDPDFLLRLKISAKSQL